MHVFSEICEINGNQYLTDKRNDTCITVETHRDALQMLPMITVSASCSDGNHTFLLDLTIGKNNSCGKLERRVNIKKDPTDCENSVRLVPCFLVKQISKENHCIFECVCHSGPCDIVLAMSNRNDINNHVSICEITIFQPIE